RLQQVGDLGRPETRDGGQIMAMAQDPAKPERFWALLWHGGLWRSDDGGASWRRGRGALADLPSTTCAIVPGQDLRIAGAEWSLQDDESGTCFGGERIAPVRSPALLTALAAADRRPRRGGWPAEPAPGRELQLLLAEFAQLEPLALPGGEFATRLVTAVRAEPPATIGDRLARARLLRRMAGDGLEYEGGRGPDEPFRASRVDAAWLAARLSEPALAADAQEHPEFLVAQLDACAWVARCGPVLRPSQVVVVMRRGQRLAAWLQARWGGERRARQAVAGFETALASGIGHGGVLLREAFTTAFGLRRDEAPRHLLILADLVAAQPSDTSARRRLAEAIGDLDGWQDALRGQLPPGVGEAWLAAARALASGPVHPAEQPCIAIAAWRALRHAPAAADDRVVPDIAALVKPADPTVRYSRRGYLHGRAASQAYDAIAKRWRAAAPTDRAAWLARFAAGRAVMTALDAGYDGMESRNPDDAKAACANHLAWALLTASDRAVHDPAAALALARQAVQTVSLAGYLDTLALAQARTGDRAGAVASQEAAIAAIAPRASAAWRRAFAQRLELYRELQADPARPLPEELFIDAAPPAKPAPAAPATPAGGF
ncbi:MAG: Sortilin, neurotensin receptor 3, partial [Pseudomonadota bacterium]